MEKLIIYFKVHIFLPIMYTVYMISFLIINAPLIALRKF